MRLNKLLVVFSANIMFVFCLSTKAQTYIIKSLKDTSISLKDHRKYKEGDDSTWAKPNFDDSNWDTTKADDPDKAFQGILWIRFHLQVDSDLVNVPLALRIVQSGASEIFIDGKKVKAYGKVSADKAS